jgi:hypothetical protein
MAVGATTPATFRPCALRGDRKSLHQPMIFLIGPPVIRIRSKPFIFKAIFDSNRHKTPTLARRLSRAYENLYPAPACRTGLAANITNSFLIENSAIGNHHQLRISTLRFF